MIHKDIEKDFENQICKTCKHLSYYDYYRCNKENGKINTLDELKLNDMKECDCYEERVGCSRNNEYKDYKCVFWCNNCQLFLNK